MAVSSSYLVSKDCIHSKTLARSVFILNLLSWNSAVTFFCILKALYPSKTYQLSLNYST